MLLFWKMFIAYGSWRICWTIRYVFRRPSFSCWGLPIFKASQYRKSISRKWKFEPRTLEIQTLTIGSPSGDNWKPESHNWKLKLQKLEPWKSEQMKPERRHLEAQAAKFGKPRSKKVTTMKVHNQVGKLMFDYWYELSKTAWIKKI